MKTIPISRAKLIEAIKACDGHVAYKLSAKPPLDSHPGDFKEADCSGFVRWLVFWTTNGEVKMPDGSQNQGAWAHKEGFKLTQFGNCGLHDGIVRMCVMKPDSSGHGHVWLVINGKTIESCGGKGVCRRKWETLKKHNPDTYVLTGVI